MARKKFTNGKAKSSKRGQSDGYDNTNRGALFINDKGDNDKRPDFTGVIHIDPDQFELDDEGLIEVRLAAWSKESENVEGGEYLSINASPPRQK